MRVRLNLAIAYVFLSLLAPAQTSAGQTVRGASQGAQRKREPVPVAIQDGRAVLTPKNTTIQFIGTHLGPEPNPRVGYFTKLTGELTIENEAKAPTAAELEIEAGSLVTPIAKLTNHLQSPDFFDVRRYPKATFKSTKIQAVNAARGRYKVTGDLTIRDVKKSISFPATVKTSEAGIVLVSRFKIKRSEFGMTFGPDRVVDDVAMTITVGKPTPKVTPQ